MKYEEAVKRFYELIKEIDYLENIGLTLAWDMRVNLPIESAEYRGNSMGFLSAEMMKRKTSPEMDELLNELESRPIEDEILRCTVRKFRKDHKHLTEVPVSLYEEYAAHNLKTEVMWQEARKANDYKAIIPWVKKEFDLKRQLAACHGYADDPMSGLMDEWEPGMSRKKMDGLFEELKAFELPFIEKLKASPFRPDPDAYLGHYPIEKQKQFDERILRAVGFSFTRGRMDVSMHPYTTANDPNDIRLTTRFFEENFTRSLLSCMHEGGHALQAQNADPRLRYTTMEQVPGYGLAESQSRFMENIIGRSLPYWEYALPIACEYFPELKRFTPEDFYNTLNCVHISPTRLWADEFTYNMHIILRYEMEKKLFDGDITFEEAPYWWNKLSEEYLFCRPQNDAEGILSDMHWYSGYIGYFQSYVLGNFYDGHYYDAMRKDIPDMWEQVRRGEFANIVNWQKQHVQQYGCMYTPAELLKGIDGEELSAKHYIAYIREKLAGIYRIEP